MTDSSAELLDRATARIELGEHLGAVSDLATATDAVAAAGGLGRVRETARAVDRDAAQLAALAARADELADRATNVEIPLDTLEQLT